MDKRVEEERLPPLDDTVLTPDQKVAADELCATPRGTVFGPFAVMLRSPEVLTHAQRLGNYLRFNCTLPIRLREMAMLITGRFWNQPYIWYVHEHVARKEGLSDEIVRAIAARKRPANMEASEAEIYDFCTQLFETRRVSDIAYSAILERHGEQGVIELTAVCGYFGILGMMMDVAHTPLPADAHEIVTDFS